MLRSIGNFGSASDMRQLAAYVISNLPVRENVKLLNGINGDVRQSVGIYEAIDHDS